MTDSVESASADWKARRLRLQTLIAEMTSANPISKMNERGNRKNSSGKAAPSLRRRAGRSGFSAK